MKRMIMTLIGAGLLATAVSGPFANAHGTRGAMPGMGMMGMGYGMMGSGCPGFGPEAMGRGHGPGMMHGWGYDADRADDQLKERLVELKKELGIGKEQASVWEDYAEAVEGRFSTMRGMHQAMHKAMFEGNAIERMEVRVGMMENMLDSMKALVPAVKALYETLPDDKKDKANALLGGCGMM